MHTKHAAAHWISYGKTPMAQVIQRRGDFGEPRENFTRSWEEYKMGFGDLEQEFWWGNDKISRLTREKPMMMRVELEAHDGRVAVAEYDTFR